MAGARLEHPATVRLCHWFGAIAVTVLVGSGLEIFAAFPKASGHKIPERDFFVPPAALRIGGWLAGALQWHLTFSWLLTGAGAVYLAYQLVSGNYRQVLFGSSDVPGVWPMVRHYFLFGPKPLERGTYNPLQKLAYTGVIVLGVLLVVTGFALYKPAQLRLWLPRLVASGSFGFGTSRRCADWWRSFLGIS